MTTTTVDKIIDGFPFPMITRIDGQPTHETIDEVNCYLNANDASIQSELGGGAYGHLDLTIFPVVLDTLSVFPFVIPLNPGATADILENSTVAQIKSVRLDHIKAPNCLLNMTTPTRPLNNSLSGLLTPYILKPSATNTSVLAHKRVALCCNTYMPTTPRLLHQNCYLTMQS